MPFVFVYGTLMRAGANHAVLVRLRGSFVGEATTCEPRVLVDLGPYPALLPGSETDHTHVHGEVWEVDDSALRELDAFEGVPDLYARERIVVASEALGGEREVFTYVFAAPLPARARRIATGRYGVPGTALPTGASPDQIDDHAVLLDNEPLNEDVSRPRRSQKQRGPR